MHIDIGRSRVSLYNLLQLNININLKFIKKVHLIYVSIYDIFEVVLLKILSGGFYKRKEVYAFRCRVFIV